MSEMYMETPTNLQETVEKLDKWMFYRFDENYSARFGDALKEELSTKVSAELSEEDLDNMINTFTKKTLAVGFEGYFFRTYATALGALYVIDSTKNTLQGDDKKIIDNVVKAATRTVQFVNSLCQNPDLTESAIEQSFVATYETPAEVYFDNLAMQELVFHVATRKQAPPTPMYEGIPAAVQDAIIKVHEYPLLLAGEHMRIHQEFAPRVMGQIVCDLYKK